MDAITKIYEEVYGKLDTNKAKKDTYRINRKRKTRDLCIVKCVKDDDQEVLIQDEKIKETWRDYFNEFCNESFTQYLSDPTI